MEVGLSSAGQSTRFLPGQRPAFHRGELPIGLRQTWCFHGTQTSSRPNNWLRRLVVSERHIYRLMSGSSRGHADSTWSCVKGLQTGRSACPPACCITPSASAATSTSAPTTTDGASDLHHPPGSRRLPLLGLRLPRGHLPRPRRAPASCALPIGSRKTDRGPADPAGRMSGLWARAPGQGPLRRPPAQLHQVLRAIRPGAVAAHDHPRRRPSPRRRLGHGQGHPEARPVAAVRQAQAQAPPRHRHRRDRRGPGAPLPDGGHGPGERRRGLRRRRQGGRRAEAVLEAAAAQRGEDRGGGHGHVGGLPGGGPGQPAQGGDRLRPLPRGQAVQRQALGPAPGACTARRPTCSTRRCSRGRGGCC